MGGFFHLKCPHERQCCQRKVTPADLLVHGPTVGFGKRYIPTCTRWLENCLVYTLRTHLRLGKNPHSCSMISNIETLSIRFLFVFFSFGHRWGSIITGIRNYSLSFGIENSFLLMGMFGGGQGFYLLNGVFVQEFMMRKKYCCIVMLTRCRRYPPCAVCIRFRETFDWPND